MYTVKYHTNSFGKIPEIVTFIPDFFNTNAIHKKVLEILENNTSEIQKELDKLNFIELFEMVDLIESHLLSKDIEVYKEYLKNNWWVNEEDFEKAQEKQKIISKKIENLKNDFPDFKLTLWISLDNFSKLKKKKL